MQRYTIDIELSPKQFAQVAKRLPLQRALVYVAENGCKWRALPKRSGSWHTIYTRVNRWSKNGVWSACVVACGVTPTGS
jgi:transposase